MKIYKIIFINFLILFFIIILIETYLFLFKQNHLEQDSILGWKLKKNLRIERLERDFYGNKYKVNFLTNENGIISIFNNKKKKKNYEFLIIGDSFSSDPYVSTDKMWYSQLGKNLKKKYDVDILINVIGAGGYSSLQQYILTKIVKDKKLINPDLIIYQFCSNDFANNSIKIEKKIGNMNQYLRRPYLSHDNKIFYDESFLGKIMRTPILGSSRILNKIIFIYSNAKKKEAINENLINESYLITDLIIKKIAKLYPKINKFIFNCNEQKNDWLKLKSIKNYDIIWEVESSIEKTKFENKKILFKDGGHYNELGHKIIGNVIFDRIVSDSIF